MSASRTLLDPVPADLLPKTGEGRLQLRASNEERAEIAKRLSLPELKSLAVEASITTESGVAISVSTQVSAQVVRTCIVTLEDFEEVITERFSARFEKRAGSAVPGDKPEEPASDDPEWFGAAGLQLGELAVQHLSVALDPYPRHPNAPPRGQADWLEGNPESELALQLAQWTGRSGRI